jgi:uncharacterized protein RhaS with RHS repeats
LQRFVSEDPIGLAGGSNLYEYVRGNPAALTDPFGLDPNSDSEPSYPGICPTLFGPDFTPGYPGYDKLVTLGDQFVDDLKNSARGGYELSKIRELIMLAKGGPQHIGDSGLIGVSDEEVAKRARDRNLSGEERRRYQKEEKWRKTRNKNKRKQ